MEEKSPVLEAIANARKAQQRYIQTHDVQLEIDLDPEEEDDVSDSCSN